MNTNRFEERLMRELESYVRDRAQAGPGTDGAQPATVTTRRRTVFTGPRKVAIGTGLAAAVAVAAFATGTAGLGGTAAQAPLQAADAAYTVQSASDGLVKLIIVDPEAKPNVDALRRDLARAGVKANVIANAPACSGKQPPTPAPADTRTARAGKPLVPFEERTENGKEVLYLNSDALQKDTFVSILFGGRLGVFEVVFSAAGDGPSCITGTLK